MVQNTGYMPANTLAMQPQYLGKFYQDNPNWQTAAKRLPRAVFVALTPSYNVLLIREQGTLVHVFDLVDRAHDIGFGDAPAELLD